MTAVRAEVVDYTRPMLVDYARILGRRGSPEVDPWGFLLPLSLNVWVALLVTLLVVIFTAVSLSACDRHRASSSSQYVSDILRTLLCQGRCASGQATRANINKDSSNYEFVQADKGYKF